MSYYNDRWLNKREVCEKLGGIGRSTLNRKVAQGIIPKPFYPYGEPGGAIWWESEILAAMQDLDYRDSA